MSIMITVIYLSYSMLSNSGMKKVMMKRRRKKKKNMAN